MRRLLTFLTLLILSCSCSGAVRIDSPSRALSVELSDVGGALSYRLWRGDDLLVDSSTISILQADEVKIIKSRKSSCDAVWEPTWGQFSQIRDNHTQAQVELMMDGREVTLYVRVFDDGVGFRYRLEDYDSTEQARFYVDYSMLSSDRLFYTAGERAPIGPLVLSEISDDIRMGGMKLPLYIQRGDDTVIAMVESDLFSADGFATMACGYNTQGVGLYAVNSVDLSGVNLVDGALITPWRVILVGSAEEVITNNVTLNLAAPVSGDFEWVKPGKTLWDWRVHGYVAPDGFKYGVDTESYRRFIDFAADNDIDYLLIDDDWYEKVNKGEIIHSRKLDMAAIIDYAAQRGVGLMLYYDRRKGDYGDEALFSHYSDNLGAEGIKYGFMFNSAQFARGAISSSAESELLVNFHDDPVPMTGVERTMPNAITREYCHAQQDSRRAFTPQTFIKMAMINSLQGPLDMNNGNFDIVGINSGVRSKSPRTPNSYLTTVISELARTLIIHTGLLCLPDAPEAYGAKEELFDFIKAMPTGEWDESVVLAAKMGEYISTARRSGEEWFVGSVADTNGCELTLTLDFLEEGVEYIATLYEDAADTDCRANPETYQICRVEVKKGDDIVAKMATGGGHAVRISPK